MEQKPQLTFEIGPEAAAYSAEPAEERLLKVRLDKWLWASRFFKTRALARAAIENGKIDYNGQKVMPSKEIELGATLTINHGQFRKVIVIKGLSTRRRSTIDAKALFEELQTEDKAVEYAPINAEVKTRKIVRFLRRAINILDSPSSY